MSFINKLMVLFMLLVFFLGCSNNDDSAMGPDNSDQQQPDLSSFSEIQDQVFTQSCAISGCHLGSSAPFGLDLSEANAYGNLVNVASGEKPSLLRVKPGQPDSSYLIMKLRGDPGISGSRMPANGPPFLEEATVDSIAAWIREGAMNN